MTEQVTAFQDTVLGYYDAHGRDLPWRTVEPDGSFDPYKILVSEMMLQQTQAGRVIPKYRTFLERFPDVRTLAEANLSQVLTQWSGLGYNRRAKYLHETAKRVATEYMGMIPKTLNTLTNLPGIGHNTAAAICVYAYNQPQIFVETNIRTVYIHHFFKNQTAIADMQLLPFIEKSLKGMDPRTFYWALMDYGTHLKASQGNLSANSKHYTKQSKFEGSKRQLRGKILKLLIENPLETEGIMSKLDDARSVEVLDQLEGEGFITCLDGAWRLSS